MTLEEFIEARIVEDEVAARNATQDESTRWAADHGLVFDGMDASWYEDELIVTPADASDQLAPQRAEHIARHDPPRVLRQCAAMRTALRWYLGDDEMVMGPTMRAIAAIWSEHPDYRQEWSV